MAESDLTKSYWLPGEPAPGYNCAVFTRQRGQKGQRGQRGQRGHSGWKAADCSTKQRTVCKSGWSNFNFDVTCYHFELLAVREIKKLLPLF